MANTIAAAQWLSIPTTISSKKIDQAGITTELLNDEDDSVIIRLSTQQSHGSIDTNSSSAQHLGLIHESQSYVANSNELVEKEIEADKHKNLQTAQLKADILSHPLHKELLAAHVACLRIATPADQVPKIDAQFKNAQHVAAKYAALRQNHVSSGNAGNYELDQFMTEYVLLLFSFKEQLQHVSIHARNAMMSWCELERKFVALTGTSVGEGTEATMLDDEDDVGSNISFSLYINSGVDGHESEEFGPLIPTETERFLMERVRQQLKAELKQGYKDKIMDVREEILRKRRAGKLPGDTTTVLKSWWQAHSKWPYPTEDEKTQLVKETGLELKQINNWFINQRKRNWHANSSFSSSSALKSKRKHW